MRNLLICPRCHLRFTEPRDACTCGGPLETAADQVRRLHREELSETAFSNGCVPGQIRFPPSLDDEDAAADQQHLEDIATVLAIDKVMKETIAAAKLSGEAVERWKAAQVCRAFRFDRRLAMDRIAGYSVHRLFKYSGLRSNDD